MTTINPFSNLEIQLIRSKLDTHSDGELAAILERPIEEVHEFIDKMTTGGADARSELVQTQMEAEFMARQNRETEIANKKKHRATAAEARDKRLKDQQEKRKLAAEKDQENLKKRDLRSKGVAKAEREWKDRKKQNENLRVFRKVPTRKVDYSQMKSVKVGKDTWVFVPKGTTIAQAIADYKSNYLDKKPEWFKKMEEQRTQ